MSRDAQRISRLTPLTDVLALVAARVAPVCARMCDVRLALGRVLAQDISAPGDSPARPLALRDGLALSSEQTLDASAYAPAALTDAVEIETAMPMPARCDAVAPYHATQRHDGPWEALAAVAQGDGVLVAGTDMRAGEMLRRTGCPLRAVDLAVCVAAGIDTVSIRVPRVLVVTTQAKAGDRVIDAIAAFLEAAVTQTGGDAHHLRSDNVADELSRNDADAILVVGGTGEGAHDASAMTLERAGELALHGVALAPGETAGFGFAGVHPVLLIPGRLDAALATWLMIGHAMMAGLTACADGDAAVPLALSRKASSPIGLTGILPLRRDGDTAEPLASGYLPWATLAQADGFAVVTAESEGFIAGGAVPMRPLP
jgi:molybdopterin biosynthesis enzyme